MTPPSETVAPSGAERRLVRGATRTHDFSVGESETARFIGGDVDALSTPVLMYWVELVASQLIRSESEGECGSVGVRVDVQHTGAAHPGDRVTVTVTVAAIIWGMVRFTVRVTDETGSVTLMEGRHDRALVRNDASHRR
ncbi:MULTISPECIES: thioesterase family protein [unclassified Bradyrhizobium]|uniref:thioesterase family protein n=1 Tax=unclassified Bradyrhizobium TaxID=2631580 RepID=UPI0028E3780E|nr:MULTISPECIES: hotdog domain-containing protein [unclassified Bradyrhizobium]